IAMLRTTDHFTARFARVAVDVAFMISSFGPIKPIQLSHPLFVKSGYRFFVSVKLALSFLMRRRDYAAFTFLRRSRAWLSFFSRNRYSARMFFSRRSSWAFAS